MSDSNPQNIVIDIDNVEKETSSPSRPLQNLVISPKDDDVTKKPLIESKSIISTSTMEKSSNLSKTTSSKVNHPLSLANLFNPLNDDEKKEMPINGNSLGNESISESHKSSQRNPKLNDIPRYPQKFVKNDSMESKNSEKSELPRITSTDVLHMRRESLATIRQSVTSLKHRPVKSTSSSIKSTAFLTEIESEPHISHINTDSTPDTNLDDNLKKTDTKVKSTSIFNNKFFRKLCKPITNPPEWIQNNIHNPVQWKDVFRSWCAVFTMLIFMLNKSTLEVLGSSAFFGMVAAIMVPPQGSFPMVARRLFLFILFVLIGWGWSLLAMSAALAVRTDSISESQYILENSNAPSGDLEALYTESIFNGDYLDTRSSVVYGVFLFTGTYIMGFARAFIKNDLIMMPTVFGSTLIDTGCAVGPLFPTFRFSIGFNFLLPILFYCAVVITCMIVLFPRSASYSYSRVMLNGLTTIQKIIDLQYETVRGSFDNQRLENLLKETIDARNKWAFMLNNMHVIRPLLKYDFYIGYFSPKDYNILQDSIFIIGARLIGLCSVQRMFQGILAIDPLGDEIEDEELKNYYHSLDGIDDESINEAMNPLPGPSYNRILTTAEDIEVLSDILQLLQETTGELFEACLLGITTSESIIRQAENHRYFSSIDGKKCIQDITTVRDLLVEERKKFKEERWNKIMEPYAGNFNEHGLPLDFAIDLNYKPMFLSMVLISSLPQVAESIIKILNLLLTILGENPKKETYSIFRSVIDHGVEQPTVFIDDELQKLQNNDKIFFNRTQSYVPKRFHERYILKPIYSFHEQLTSPYGVYAFKYATLSVCLWLPAVFSSTARFYYGNRGVWAIIMGQAGLSVFAGEQLTNIFARVLATCGGLIIGILAWYISSGNGVGNPYGIGVVMGILFVPLMMFRLWHPRIVASIVCSVTIVLIVGYSYVNTHLPSVLNPGYGISIAIRRFITVLIGMTASFIMMLIPSPKSYLHHIQKLHSTALQTVEVLIGRMIEVSRIVNPERRREKLGKLIRYLFAVNLDCKQIRAMTPMAKTEPQVKTYFSVRKYIELCNMEINIVESLIQLALTLRSVNDSEWYDRVVKTGIFKDVSIVRDIMISLHILSDSMLRRVPIPNIIPTKFGHHRHEFDVILQSKAMHISSMSWDDINHPDFPTFASGMVSSFHVIILIKRLELAVIDVLDEDKILDLRGYELIENSIVEEEIELIKGLQSTIQRDEERNHLQIENKKNQNDHSIVIDVQHNYNEEPTDNRFNITSNGNSKSIRNSNKTVTPQITVAHAPLSAVDSLSGSIDSDHVGFSLSSGEPENRNSLTTRSLKDNRKSYARFDDTVRTRSPHGTVGLTSPISNGLSVGGFSSSSSVRSTSPEKLEFLARHPELNRLGNDALHFAMMTERSSPTYNRFTADHASSNRNQGLGSNLVDPYHTYNSAIQDFNNASYNSNRNRTTQRLHNVYSTRSKREGQDAPRMPQFVTRSESRGRAHTNEHNSRSNSSNK